MNTNVISNPRSIDRHAAPEQPREQLAPDRLLQIGLGFWNTKTLLSAVELGLFTQLAAGPLGESQLISRLGLHGRGARDFFDALVAMNLLDRTADAYSNTAEADLFLDKNKPSYIGGIFEMAGQRLYDAWGNLTKGLKTGQPQNGMNEGRNLFAEMYSNPVRLREFLSAMTGISMGAAKALASVFPWSNYREFIDVGAAQGCVPVQLALAHPHLRGANFDLPEVRPVYEEYVNSFGLGDRLRFQEGNFFKDPIPKTEVIVMGHILHDWDMAEKRMLLKKAYDALPSGGALIVYEALIDDDRRRNLFGLLMSLNMLIETRGGFDYTGADCAAWMRETGFHETRVEQLCGPDSMVVAFK